MTARSSKGITICMTGDNSASTSFTELAITGVSKTAKAELTVAGSAASPGDIISIAGTGFTELDGKVFVVDAASTPTKIIVVGADTTASVGTLVPATAKVKVFEKKDETCLCLSSISLASDTPGTVSVATYCEPTATLPSSVYSAGTLTFTGYVDVASTDYPALLKAAEDSRQRYIRISLPQNGYLIFPFTLSSISYDLPIDGAVSFTGTGALGSKAVHRF